jgi:hypothetical protein
MFTAMVYLVPVRETREDRCPQLGHKPFSQRPNLHEEFLLVREDGGGGVYEVEILRPPLTSRGDERVDAIWVRDPSAKDLAAASR